MLEKKFYELKLVSHLIYLKLWLNLCITDSVSIYTLSLTVSFNSRELELARRWDEYCCDNHITRSSAIKRLIKIDLKEQLLAI